MAAPKGCMCKIAPSILNADLSNLAVECQRFMDSGSDYLHLDVMDGHFVPNLTFGHPVVKCLRRKLPDAFFEMHMMVSKPEQWIEPAADAGGNMYSFHYEATADPAECMRKIKEAGMKVGLALNPDTPVEVLTEDLVNLSDLILIMTVHPGFGGQKFMSDCLKKVSYLRNKHPVLDIEVDGGVGLTTVRECAEAGANVIVSGSALVNSDDPRRDIGKMRHEVEEALQRASLER